MKNCNLQKHFASVSYYLEIKDGERRLALCHYPMLSWGGSARGSLHVHATDWDEAEPDLEEINSALKNAVEFGLG